MKNVYQNKVSICGEQFCFQIKGSKVGKSRNICAKYHTKSKHNIIAKSISKELKFNVNGYTTLFFFLNKIINSRYCDKIIWYNRCDDENMISTYVLFHNILENSHESATFSIHIYRFSLDLGTDYYIYYTHKLF